MTQRTIQITIRVVCAALFLIGAVMTTVGSERVEAKNGIALQATDEFYPVETLPNFFGYPFATETDSDLVTPAAPTSSPEQQSTPTNTPTPGPSPTPAPDVYGTEDAQIGDSIVTPPSSPTPGSSITPVSSPTAVFTATGTTAAVDMTALESGAEPDGFQVNWGFFMVGFVIPVLMGCGVVLYLLDRRPDLFARRSKP